MFFYNSTSPVCLGEAMCYLFLFYSFIISVAFYSNALRLSVFLHLACRGRFFFVSRCKHTYTYSFFFTTLRLLRHNPRPFYNCVNLCVYCASGLPAARSITSCLTLVDSGCPFSLCSAIDLFMSFSTV